MNPQSIFHVLTANGAQVLAISNAIGIQALISLAPHLAAIEKSYSAGGIIAVLEHNGPDVQKIIEAIGAPNLAVIAPNAAAILKTLNIA